MQQSTIHITCPQCGKNGLLTEIQGKYFCALCMFDYSKLKDEPEKLDAVLIDTVKQKGFGPICASTLYQRFMLKPPAEAVGYIQILAGKNNIDLYQGHHFFLK